MMGNDAHTAMQRDMMDLLRLARIGRACCLEPNDDVLKDDLGALFNTLCAQIDQLNDKLDDAYEVS